MEKQWERIYMSVAWNELQGLRIRGYTHHGKLLTTQQHLRIQNKLDELRPYYEKFVELYGNDEFYFHETDKISIRFSEFLRECEKGKKIRKIMKNIKK
jgi:hypothetical protein